MKRILLTLTSLAVAVMFGTSVFAYPNLTQKTGKPCSYCHTNPKGGKELTAAGQYYKKNGKLPPAAKPAPKKKPAKGAGAGKGPSAGQRPSAPRDEAPLK